MSTKESLNNLAPLYFANEHNLDVEVFEPICRLSSSVRCMSGYFSSGSLRELAKSLSYFLKTSDASIKFIVSPNLLPEDVAALNLAITTDSNLIPLLFPGFEPTEDNLRSRAVESLAYLVSSGRMIFKLAIQQAGLFHTKCWLFNTKYGRIAVHGSVNATSSGLSVNTEQIGVDKEWENNNSKIVVTKIEEKFEALWDNQAEGVTTFELNRVTLTYLEEIAREKSQAGHIEKEILARLERAIEEQSSKKFESQLRVPNWLNYQTGEYAHQGEAITSWIANGNGILSIATGGGKTLTSLVAAAVATQKEKALLVLIAVPTKALLDQWEKDVLDFSVKPFNSLGKPVRQIKSELKAMFRRLRHGISKNEVLIITHEKLKSDLVELVEIGAKTVAVMLIGDEVHNLGSSGFQESARDCFKYRLGLSATAVRQFDEAGTHFLTEYFGPVVYDFPLEVAIGTCLVPYNYFVYRVALDENEEEAWADLTHQIRQLSYAAELPDSAPDKERWKLLCLQRRRIVESASGKIAALASVLPSDRKKIQRALVFCTDKAPQQLIDVNALLTRRSVNFHQLTSEETSSKRLLQKIIDSFGKGELQVLTSKRVLDEGFNIPQTEVAYFLASNTVRRQWIQRLGRVLRLSSKTNKTRAEVHDFVVIPSSGTEKMDPDLKGLIRGEYERVSFFSKLSMNGLEKSGPIEVMRDLIDLMEDA